MCKRELCKALEQVTSQYINQDKVALCQLGPLNVTQMQTITAHLVLHPRSQMKLD